MPNFKLENQLSAPSLYSLLKQKKAALATFLPFTIREFNN